MLSRLARELARGAARKRAGDTKAWGNVIHEDFKLIHCRDFSLFRHSNFVIETVEKPEPDISHEGTLSVTK